ncbi:hypothetical protein K3495_g13753 [Podosphaera aphanis]|nr:hypothetical protein K3495_g13753 [Podosphaera aphanis]
MLPNSLEKSIAFSHLTETELKQLHRRFGYPSVGRLTRVLQRAGYDVNRKALEHLTKFCHYCQMNGKLPGRFKFTLKNDYEFNYSIIIDVLYIDGKPVLHVIDSSTNFGASRFLTNMTALTTWNTLRYCWIDTYQGPPDQIVHDAGKNFASDEFRQLAKSMSIDIKEVPVESHNSIGLVERYHAPLRRAFNIIKEELKDEKVGIDLILQMAQKSNPPSPSVTKRAEAIRLAMQEIRKIQAKRQVADALGMRNGPNTKNTESLPLNSDVRVWRERKGWMGPYKLLNIDGQTCTVAMPNGPVNFRSTVVKPYYSTLATQNNNTQEHIELQSQRVGAQPEDVERASIEEQTKNLKITFPNNSGDNQCKNQPLKRYSLRSNRNNVLFQFMIGDECHHSSPDLKDQSLTSFKNSDNNYSSFITNKEIADRDLAVNLRSRGVITTPGAPFEAAQKQEIDNLIARGVFDFVNWEPKGKHAGVRVFNSRLVNEVKGKTTDRPYEKSRLVIQAYNDDGKDTILTQSPTIQRSSQRIIAALAPSLNKNNINLYIRDVNQAYTQSSTLLNRLILAKLPKEIANQFAPDIIMVVRKPLYGIPEAGTHWWATYNKHHREKLGMESSTYDPCLLITKHIGLFGIVGVTV